MLEQANWPRRECLLIDLRYLTGGGVMAITRIARLFITHVLGCITAAAATAHAQRQMENLGRRVINVNQGEGKVYVGRASSSVAFDEASIGLKSAAMPFYLGGSQCLPVSDPLNMDF
jgi:hypothetical protein